MSENWRKVRAICGHPTKAGITGLKIGDEVITDPKQMAEIIAKHCARQACNDNRSCAYFKHKKYQEEQLQRILRQLLSSPLDHPFSLPEIKQALNSFRGTTPGLDNITFGMIKQAPELWFDRVKSLFDLILDLGRFPREWKLAEIRPIPKTNTKILHPSETRPISLLKTVSKILEKMVASRLGWLMEQKLQPTIWSYRPGRGTTTLLQELEHNLACALSRGHHTVVLSIDLEKAFDRTPKFAVLHQLAGWQAGKKMVKLVDSYLTDRRIKTRVGGHFSPTHNLDNGLPQGSPLSVHLFNAYVHTLAVRLQEVPDLLFHIYADNLVCYASGSPPLVTSVLDTALRVVSVWAEVNGAKLASNKLEALHVCRRKKCKANTLESEIASLPLQKDLRILGLRFTKNLSWVKQAKLVAEDLRKRNNLLRVVCKRNSGPPLATATHIARQLVMGKVDYGITVYGFLPKRAVATVQTAINAIARTALGALRTTSIDSLLVEAGFPSFLQRREMLAINLACKNLHHPHSPLHLLTTDLVSAGSLPRRSQRSALGKTVSVLPPPLKQIPFFPHLHNPIPQTPPWKVRTERIITKELDYQNADDNVKMLLHRETIHRMGADRVLYTDASKNERGVALAVTYAPTDHGQNQLQMQKGLPPWASVYTAELTAIWEAVRWAVQQHGVTAVCSDSLSALKAIENTRNIDPLAVNVRHSLSTGRIWLAWCPAHVGIPGNETADRLAKEALQKNPTMTNPPAYNAARAHCRKLAQAISELHWRNSNSFLARHHNIITQPAMHELPRQLMIAIARVRLGHFLAIKEHLFSRGEPPSCSYCNDVRLTANHIFYECGEVRRRLLDAGTNVQPTDLLTYDKTNATILLSTLKSFLHDLGCSTRL